MATQILNGLGNLVTVSDMADFMAANPVGAQAVAASRAMSPATTADSTKARITSTTTVNATLVSSAARVLRTLDIYNEAGYAVYFKLYDKASTPVVATDTPFWTIPLPANTGFSKYWPFGIPVTLGLGYVISKLKPDNDTTVIAAGDVVGMLTWR